MNGIFSCLVGYSNDLLKKREKGGEGKAPIQPQAAQGMFGELIREPWFDGTRVDLIYTVDGSLVYPVREQREKACWVRTVELEVIGKPKRKLLPDSIVPGQDPKGIKPNTDLYLSFIFDFKHPESALGQFICYLQHYVSRLVKSSPDFYTIFGQAFATPEYSFRETLQIPKS